VDEPAVSACRVDEPAVSAYKVHEPAVSAWKVGQISVESQSWTMTHHFHTMSTLPDQVQGTLQVLRLSTGFPFEVQSSSTAGVPWSAPPYGLNCFLPCAHETLGPCLQGTCMPGSLWGPLITMTTGRQSQASHISTPSSLLIYLRCFIMVHYVSSCFIMFHRVRRAWHGAWCMVPSQ
jgi:hypothetical protein